MTQEKWLIDSPKTIDIGLIRSLNVALVGGQVDIVGHDEQGARVEVHSISGRDLKISVDGDVLEIDHPQLRWDNFLDSFKSFKSNARADISIMVPRDVALKFGIVSASALISGLKADASISTVSGDVVIDQVEGDLKINSISGEISIKDHEGDISAHLVNGDITAMGEIEKFSTDTVSGDVFLDITGTPNEVALNTVTGNITVRLAPGQAAEYRINTVSGRLNVDDSEIKGVRGSYSGKYGTLDKNWLEFKANTISGNISVLHAVSA
ncbi:MAG TPA: DUF4097 family beta strand repeat-containing protein [Glaciihabitans sp.]|jgi:DUF4097 and DUF4098 domain-containing protein YvlB|nr:DUF4097 family beta strand repeat-containing protein [Glaciihabitans sp.]